MSALRRPRPSPSDQQSNRSDLGPEIQRVAIIAIDGEILREARVDVVKAERMGESARGIAWLPVKLCAQGKLTMAQAAIASRWRDHIDLGEGVSDRGPATSRSGTPWNRANITDVQLAARILMDEARRDLSRQTILLCDLIVVADTLAEVALASGLGRSRILTVIGEALDALDDWWAGRK
jgi:hypothetical protein